jgi:hypothetical protein
MADAIRRATCRVVLAAPSLHKRVAEALKETFGCIGRDRITVVTDCDERVFRLGYGEIDALKLLRESGVPLCNSPGLRVGILICDDEGWCFAPTALYVQEEPHSDETPNAIRLSSEEVTRLVVRMVPGEKEAVLNSECRPELKAEIATADVEVGVEPLNPKLVEATAANLEIAPPVKFDIARQVRVFEPYIQYVEINLRGCSIERHKVAIPKSLLAMGANKQVAERLRTTFDLIERTSALSAKPIEDELRKVREMYAKPLGEPWGRVILRVQRPAFDRCVQELRKKIAEHQTAVQLNLQTHINHSLAQVTEYYLPIVKERPPEDLTSQITTVKPSKMQAKAWIEQELKGVFPSAASLVKNMVLDVQYRDVTFETLNNPDFAAALKKAYPMVDWDKPFNEFQAAKAKEDKP